MPNLVFQSALTLCVAGTALLIAVLQVLFFMKKPKSYWNLWGGAIALSTCAYATAVVIQYNTVPGDLNLLSERIQFTALLLLIYSAYGYAVSLLRIPSRRLHRVSWLIIGILLAVLWTTDLIISPRFVAREFLLLEEPYYEPHLGILGSLYMTLLVIAAFAILFLWRWADTSTARQTKSLEISIVIWGILGLHDALATFGMPSIQFLMEYGFWGISVAMLTVTVNDYASLIRTAQEQSHRIWEEKERLAITLWSIADGVIVTDALGRIVLMNRAAEHILNLHEDQCVGQNISGIFAIIDESRRDPLPNPVRRVLQMGSNAEVREQAILISHDKKELFIDLSTAPILSSEGKTLGAILVCRDHTQKRVFERELQKAQQIESIGVLAGGLAHDFNNILAAILGNIEIANIELADQGQFSEELREAKKAALRARSLTQQLLTFSKGGAPIRKATSMGSLLMESATFVLSGSKVKCHFDIAENLWNTNVDPDQISQVIQNIVINAKQAMEDGGIVDISARNVNDEVPAAAALKGNRCIEVSVRDSGTGIPKPLLDRIFEPYFTTKPSGSGLGLATSFSIVKRHGGTLTVDSELGRGTTVHIYLPVTDSKAEPTTTGAHPRVEGEGRILIMDDDEQIRKLAKRVLERSGYTVDLAQEGQQAVEKYQSAQQEGQGYQAVVMDLTVPGGMGGEEAIGRILEIDPQAKVIVSSGYSNDPIMSEYRTYGFVGVVTKPFVVDELLETLRQVIRQSVEGLS